MFLINVIFVGGYGIPAIPTQPKKQQNRLRVKCVDMAGMPYPPKDAMEGCVDMARMPYPPKDAMEGCVGMAGMPYPPKLLLADEDVYWAAVH